MQKKFVEVGFQATRFPSEIIGKVYTYYLDSGKVDRLKIVYYDDSIEKEFMPYFIKKSEEQKCVVIFEKVAGQPSTWCEKVCGDNLNIKDIIRGAPYGVPIPEDAMDRIVNFYDQYYPSWFNWDYYAIIPPMGVVAFIIYALIEYGPCIFSLGLYCPAA